MSILMSNVICVHRPTPCNTIEDAHAKILAISAIERQLSLGDTNYKIVGHQCNLSYVSK